MKKAITIAIIVLFVVGCGGNQPWKRNTLNMYSGAVDITLSGYQMLDDMCTQGLITPADCNEGMRLYSHVKDALYLSKQALKEAASAEKKYLEVVSSSIIDDETKARAKLSWEKAMEVASEKTKDLSRLANEFYEYLVKIGVFSGEEA